MTGRARTNVCLVCALLFCLGLLTGLVMNRRAAGPSAAANADVLAAAGATSRDLQSVPLDQAIGDLASRSHKSIVVQWDVLETMGIDRTTPIRVTMEGVPFESALATVLALAEPTGELTFRETDGVVVISSGQYFALGAIIRIYNARDIIERLTNSYAGAPSTSEPSRAREEAVAQLITLIETGIDPISWTNSGGGAIREVGGLLMVTQSPKNQTLVRNFLNEIRAGSGPHTGGAVHLIQKKKQ